VLAQEKVIKVGTLKLIHGITPYFYEKFAPAGYKIEVIPFESPTDGKNAVMTGTVDFGTFGIAAATLGAAAGEPLVIFAAQCNRGHGGGGRRHVRHQEHQGPEGQEGRDLARLDTGSRDPGAPQGEGMTIKDIQHVRCRSPTWRRRSRAATSMPTSAPSRVRHQRRQRRGQDRGVSVQHAIGSLNMVWA